ncbi:LuxR family transcriptional regulator [Mycobacterium sp. 21AC1]|uniref:LuxR family transcriptional regulator n=1 Tax=[Mycobacterium] appelbergii TaxID=2939269 RepID=UPI00293934CC|nr:LuxR family transcriptional regulator [Mycobacterium sp. 21AC1]MDV3130394.1 LuxR family transcriptional regulator [Mycobacterium sp. 21AC1]
MTLLLARVEGLAQLWQTQPDELLAALPWLRATTSHMVALNDGVLRPGPKRCDSFTAAFVRPSDAVSCALDLQLSPLDPFVLSIGVHSAESDAARLRDIAQAGQTLVADTTAPWVGDRLPAGATLKPRQDGHFQLCHAGLPRQFQPLPAQ